jgi:two-component system sensor histidine kinase/response regulator
LLATTERLSVTVAGNGREALEALSKDTYDVVLMDVQMPEMDGLEATAVIRERKKKTGEHIPIVALTAHAMKGDAERCLSMGMDAYISKPLRFDELLRTMEKLCGTGRGPGFAADSTADLSEKPG